MSETPKPVSELTRWWHLILATILVIFTSYLPPYSFSVLIGPLEKAFARDHTVITLWFLLWSLGCITAGPLVGDIADRAGARTVIWVGLPVVGICLLLESLQTSVWIFIGLAFAVGAASTTTSALTCGRLLSAHFDRRLGTALGLMSCGVGVSAIIGPSILQRIGDALGWRAAYAIMGLIAFGALPLVALLTRGINKPITISHGRAPYRLWRHLLHSRLLLIMTLAVFMFGVATSGAMINMVTFLTHGGVSHATAALIVSIVGFCTLAGRGFTGLTIDRISFHIGVLMAAIMVTMAISFIMIGFGNFLITALGIGLYAFFLGAEVDCLAYCIARLFGKIHFGTIYGFLGVSILSLGTGTGPLLFNLTVTVCGSYTSAFAVWAVIALCAACLFLTSIKTPYSAE